MKLKSFGPIFAFFILGVASLFPDNARIDVDGRDQGIKLLPGSRPAHGRIENAGWLQGDLKDQDLMVEIPAGVEWASASFSFTPEKDGVVSMNVKGEWHMKDVSHPEILKPIWILYDDFTARNAEIKNGGFAGSAEGWSLKGEAQFVEDRGHDKPGCAKVWHNAPAIRNLAVKGGKEVTVSFWFRRASDESPLRIFTIGHSFHANWLPGWLSLVEDLADVTVHEQLGALHARRIPRHSALGAARRQQSR